MDTSTAPARLRSRPSWLLGQATVRAQRIVGGALEEVGAHRSHYALLAALDEDGPSSQADLGRRIGIDRSDMVGLVNALATAELVRREPDRSDLRRNLITITGAGRRRLAALDRRVDVAQEALLEPLDARDRRELVRLLTTVVDHHTSTG